MLHREIIAVCSEIRTKRKGKQYTIRLSQPSIYNYISVFTTCTLLPAIIGYSV